MQLDSLYLFSNYETPASLRQKPFRVDDLTVCKAVVDHPQCAGMEKMCDLECMLEKECRSHMIPIQNCSVVDGYKCQDTSAHEISLLYCITWKVILLGLENAFETYN